MRKMILYSAMSLDGYIARKDGDVSWLEDIEPPANPKEDYGYGDLMKQIDTTVMGNTTYQQVLGFDVPFPYSGLKNYVITTDTGKTKDENVTYVSKNLKLFFAELKLQAGKGIWLIGGGKVNTWFINEGLIDEILLTQFPVILGKGIPLFAGMETEHQLKLESIKQYENGLTKLRYLVKS